MAETAVRIIGAVLVLSGAAGLGRFYAMRFTCRLQILEELRRLLYLLKGEILYANASLEEAFSNTGGRGTGPMKELFEQVADRLGKRQGETFRQMWEEETERIRGTLPLTQEDICQMKDFGRQLGYLDRQMQERTILLYLEQLEHTIDNLRKHRKEQCRLYASLSVAGGLFFIIIMC